MIKLDSFHFLLSDVDLHYRQLLSAGTASASFGSKNRFLQSLQTRAFPAGVNGSPLQTTAVNSDNTCYTSWDCSFAFVPP